MLASVYSICRSVSITRGIYVNTLGVQSVVGDMNVRVDSSPVQLPANDSSIGTQAVVSAPSPTREMIRKSSSTPYETSVVWEKSRRAAGNDRPTRIYQRQEFTIGGELKIRMQFAVGSHQTLVGSENNKSFVGIHNGRNRYLPLAEQIHIVCDEPAL